MKKIIPLVLVILTSCSNNHKQEKHEINPDCVYVCSGSGAKRYHSIDDCKGLRKCSGEIIQMTVERRKTMVGRLAECV